ncbi:hypothetical protein [Streptosporangium sp. OZ121]|uniref:hypothetical protein n=1 Tax=Streptosporangium sp. OZ121 TaxID=3444183 RepID=UPI003F79FB8E
MVQSPALARRGTSPERLPSMRRLQSQGPVHEVRTQVGHDAWPVTGYEQVRRRLDDDRLGRAHPDPPNAARSGESVLFGGPHGDYDNERADHVRMRSLLQPHFSAGRMRALRPRVEALAAGLLDELARRESPVDLNEALALPLPIAVICELLLANPGQWQALREDPSLVEGAVEELTVRTDVLTGGLVDLPITW